MLPNLKILVLKLLTMKFRDVIDFYDMLLNEVATI